MKRIKVWAVKTGIDSGFYKVVENPYSTISFP